MTERRIRAQFGISRTNVKNAHKDKTLSKRNNFIFRYFAIIFFGTAGLLPNFF